MWFWEITLIKISDRFCLLVLSHLVPVLPFLCWVEEGSREEVGYGWEWELGSHYIAQAGFRFSALLIQLPKALGLQLAFLPILVIPSLGSVVSTAPHPHPGYPRRRLHSSIHFAGSTFLWPSSPLCLPTSPSSLGSSDPLSSCASKGNGGTGSGPSAVNRRDRSLPSTPWHTALQLPFLWLQLFEKIFTCGTKHQSSWMAESLYERQMGWEEAQTCTRLHMSKKPSLVPGVMAHA